MRASEIIEKKKRGESLSPEELKWLLDSFMSGAVTDYQMAAWLMAVCFKGMSAQEQNQWTQLMWRSGQTLPRKNRSDFWIDKHSTGGVGDKTSLILVPLLVSLCERLIGKGQVKFPMVSGRGLGHTGGTLDKLESVPGFSCRLPLDQSLQLLEKNSFFMIGQTDEIAPADRRIYALRDATATVDSIPLIVSSILSKKLAENLDGIVFDVKVGTGAFMKHLEEGKQLAHALVQASKHQGVSAVAVVTEMNAPLGRAVGNSLEVQECWEFLCGTRDPELEVVVLALGSHMLSLASRGKLTVESSKAEIQQEFSRKNSRELFVKMFENQKGDWRRFEKEMSELSSNYEEVVFCAPVSGWLLETDALAIGNWVHQRGGGRKTAADSVDHSVGIQLLKKRGDSVKVGEPLARCLVKRGDWNHEIQKQFEKAFYFASEPPKLKPLVLEVVQ